MPAFQVNLSSIQITASFNSIGYEYVNEGLEITIDSPSTATFQIKPTSNYTGDVTSYTINFIPDVPHTSPFFLEITLPD